VLEKSAQLLPARYCEVIGLRLWRTAAVCGTYRDWEYADRCVHLAGQLGVGTPPEGRVVFRWLCRLHPHAAVRLREAFIRLLRPHLRTGGDDSAWRSWLDAGQARSGRRENGSA
jgi:hypothetical protein